jgi:predicted dehydrogenase
MAMNYKEAKKMIEARNKANKVLTIGYQNRFRPEYLYLKNLANKDMFGEIYYSEAIAIRRRAVPTWGVFIDEEKQGGGPLIDIGTHSLDLALFMMNNYEPDYCVGKTFHKLNKTKNTGNVWGDWDTEAFTAEDSAFGFVVMKNGAVVYLKTSWALNHDEPREATIRICGEKAGADTLNGLKINHIMEGRQCITTPDMNTGAVAYFDGDGGDSQSDKEAECFLRAIRGEGELYVTAEQAACVTRILEGIYKSEQTNKPYYFTDKQ